MKTIIILLLLTTPVYAQCVAEIKDVKQDQIFGSILVETEYKLNGQTVQIGQVRYNEGSGNNAQIIAKAKADIETHCKNLIRRIPNNLKFIQDEKLKRQKDLTTPIISNIEPSLVGHKTKSITEYSDNYKGKTIKVTYDEKNTVTDTVP